MFDPRTKPYGMGINCGSNKKKLSQFVTTINAIFEYTKHLRTCSGKFAEGLITEKKSIFAESFRRDRTFSILKMQTKRKTKAFRPHSVRRGCFLCEKIFYKASLLLRKHHYINCGLCARVKNYKYSRERSKISRNRFQLRNNRFERTKDYFLYSTNLYLTSTDYCGHL